MADEKPDVEGLTKTKRWLNHDEATDWRGNTVVSADYKIIEYQAEKNNEFNEDHYLYWLWASAKSHSGWSWEGNIYNLWMRINAEDGHKVVKYSPDEDHKGESIEIPIDLSAQPLGLGASTSGSFTLRQNKVRPHPEHTAIGSNGKFATQWIGDYEGTQALNGSLQIARPSGASRSISGKVKIKGGKYPKV